MCKQKAKGTQIRLNWMMKFFKILFGFKKKQRQVEKSISKVIR